jgi:hypothetical protein
VARIGEDVVGLAGGSRHVLLEALLARLQKLLAPPNGMGCFRTYLRGGTARRCPPRLASPRSQSGPSLLLRIAAGSFAGSPGPPSPMGNGCSTRRTRPGEPRSGGTETAGASGDTVTGMVSGCHCGA